MDIRATFKPISTNDTQEFQLDKIYLSASYVNRHGLQSHVQSATGAEYLLATSTGQLQQDGHVQTAQEIDKEIDRQVSAKNEADGIFPKGMPQPLPRVGE